MIDHVSIGVSDLAKAVALYEQLLSTLGHRKLTEAPGTVGAGSTSKRPTPAMTATNKPSNQRMRTLPKKGQAPN